MSYTCVTSLDKSQNINTVFIKKCVKICCYFIFLHASQQNRCCLDIKQLQNLLTNVSTFSRSLFFLLVSHEIDTEALVLPACTRTKVRGHSLKTQTTIHNW